MAFNQAFWASTFFVVDGPYRQANPGIHWGSILKCRGPFQLPDVLLAGVFEGDMGKFSHLMGKVIAAFADFYPDEDKAVGFDFGTVTHFRFYEIKVFLQVGGPGVLVTYRIKKGTQANRLLVGNLMLGRKWHYKKKQQDAERGKKGEFHGSGYSGVRKYMLKRRGLTRGGCFTAGKKSLTNYKPGVAHTSSTRPDTRV